LIFIDLAHDNGRLPMLFTASRLEFGATSPLKNKL
jgi:hypothetical protein